ncbi:sigma-70 family RNA polymerase sigma factor [Reinekea thalattae]|uniref:Sigma-70 family RNA polymerase sigma factor n=1 Tax=Reinekea thalattae TaxID=2593301 RepID=A0A5C8Z5G1_9GAMM|nr:sigma-70 family RNA polymerase sigma factor [Reinekea thalattae]TXR52146.1 sigma-70 family RNA polymerase sigma factor [Reinekea thalattae]
MQLKQSSTLQYSANCIKSVAMKQQDEHQQLAQWLSKVATNRDKAAFTELFKYFSPRVHQFALSKYGNESLANEVVQEAMTNVWRKAHLYNADKGAPTTWVYTLSRNVAFDLLRKINNSKEDNLSEDLWPVMEDEQTPLSLLSGDLDKAWVKQTIAKLPEKQQQVIHEFYFKEQTHEQVAQQLEIPLGTVKSRLRLAIVKLKQMMEVDDD